MKQRAVRQQLIRETEDRARLAAEREKYSDAVVGASCPRCAAILAHAARDRARGIPPGSWAEVICWLCHDTGLVAAS